MHRDGSQDLIELGSRRAFTKIAALPTPPLCGDAPPHAARRATNGHSRKRLQCWTEQQQQQQRRFSAFARNRSTFGHLVV